MWQKPTGEGSSTRHGEKTYPWGELRQNRPYKSPFVHFKKDLSLQDSLGHWRKRENKGKYRENLRSKEHKDWRKTQDQWDIMVWFYSISSFLLVRLPWQWVTKLFLLGLNVVNSISMYFFWLGCYVILIYLMILMLFLLSMFDLMDLNGDWKIPFESRVE